MLDGSSRRRISLRAAGESRMKKTKTEAGEDPARPISTHSQMERWPGNSWKEF